MQVLVTGSAGFIGLHGVEAWRDAGKQEFCSQPSPSPDEEYAALPAHTARAAG